MINIKKFNLIELDPDLQFSIFLFVKVVVFTIVSVSSFRLYGDMVEMFCLSQEFQWGYHKHPPFAPWFASVWFFLFPVNKFSYFFFAQVNSAIGMIFTYLLSKDFLSKPKALISALMLVLLIVPTLKAIKYNNDSILLSTWPMCTFFVFKAFKYDKKIYWALAGITSGIAILSKYYSVLLLATMLLIFILNNKKNTIKRLTTPGPIICILLFLIIIFPNFYWILKHNFMPLDYVNLTLKDTINKRYVNIFWFIFANLSILVPIILLGKLLFKIKYKEMFIPHTFDSDKVFLSAIVFIPFILTIVFGFYYKIYFRFGIPLWFLFTTFVISKSNEFSRYSIKVVNIIVYSFLISCFIFIPIINAYSIKFKQGRDMYKKLDFLPYKEISNLITKKWQDLHKISLKYIAGDTFLAYNISFYSIDHPSALINFNYKISPWITEEKIKESGIAIVCYHYRNNTLNQSDNCIPSAEDTFKWANLAWQKINIGEYYFSYAFIPPHYNEAQ